MAFHFSSFQKGLMLVLILELFPQELLSQSHYVVIPIDTIGTVVNVHVSYSETPICGHWECLEHLEVVLHVSPCPLSEECSDSIFSWTHGGYNESEYQLLLGESYRFYGSYSVWGGINSQGFGCDMSCFTSGSFVEKVFPDDFVSTTNSTWGRIKALYNSN